MNYEITTRDPHVVCIFAAELIFIQSLTIGYRLLVASSCGSAAWQNPWFRCNSSTHPFFGSLPWLYTYDVWILSDTCIKNADNMSGSAHTLTNIPELNRTVVQYLAMFLYDFAKAESVTKMGVDNLAMVFAPAFLRSHDPQTMLLNTYNEGAFVHNVIASCGTEGIFVFEAN